MKKKKEETKKRSRVSFVFPMNLLKPVAGFLKQELKKVTRQEKKLEERNTELPENNNRAAVDSEVVEQVGRMGMEAKKRLLRARVVQIRKALTRIKIGKYGVCEKCGVMIDTDRLTVYPEATVCVACEKERES